MPVITNRYCDFCGAMAESYTGPVDPKNPQAKESPPGTGWHRHSGPSWGMGFPEMEYYCSDECLNRRVILKEEPIREQFDFETKWQHPVKAHQPQANKNRQK